DVFWASRHTADVFPNNIVSSAPILPPTGKPQESYASPSNEMPVRWQRRYARPLGSWGWEILALLAASCAMVSMVVLLIYFDGKKVPDWPVAINLTTVISLLVTVFKATLLAAMAEFISQTKWLWFRKNRRLMDLQNFDEASRNALGAVKFLGGGVRTFTATLGAAVVIVSVAAGPFSQQAIKTVTCLQPSPAGSASIPVVNVASGGFFRYGAGLFRLYLDVQGALISAMVNPLGKDSTLTGTCSTGNCTFADYGGVTHSTMGLCRACADLSSWVYPVNDSVNYNRSGSYSNYTFPGRYYANGGYIGTLSGSAALDVLYTNLSFFPSGTFGDMSTAFAASITNFTLLTFTTAPCSLSPGALEKGCQNNLSVSNVYSGGKMRPLAISCALYPCLKNFHGTIYNGELQERLVSTVPATQWAETLYSQTGWTNHTVLKTPCTVDGKVYDISNFSLLHDVAPKNSSHEFQFQNVISYEDRKNISAPFECIYKFDWLYSLGVSRFLQDYIFRGTCFESLSRSGVLNCENSVFWLYGFWNDGASNLTFVEGFMERFVTAATNKFRVDGHTGLEVVIDAVGVVGSWVDAFGRSVSG
ncbi:hypothetical protein B0T16DRAFT_508580, partial [Cercophora newfieldiana]